MYSQFFKSMLRRSGWSAVFEMKTNRRPCQAIPEASMFSSMLAAPSKPVNPVLNTAW